jgi:hypothetical protein
MHIQAKIVDFKPIICEVFQQSLGFVSCKRSPNSDPNPKPYNYILHKRLYSLFIKDPNLSERAGRAGKGEACEGGGASAA